MDSRIGATISHYRITEHLGGGGMGVVYKAEDTRLGRAVALKFLPEHLAEDHQALERFQREARAASALNHPNICSIFDIAEHDGQPFMAMEFLDGATLKERLSQGPMPFEELLEISLQVIEGLSVAHEGGILHRDLKPANLFWTTHGFAKILDFGLAKLEAGPAESDSFDRTATMLADDLTQEGSTVGTVAYMAPEQARGEPVDARSDLFSLGTVLYELATGRQAFGGSTTALTFDAILHHPPTPLTNLQPDLPPEFVHIVDKALEKDPAMRYQSAAELKSDLLRLRRDTSSGHSLAAQAVATPSKRSPWPLALGGLAALALIAVLALWPRGREPVSPGDPTSRDPTIAVLPFHNLAGVEDLDYLRFAVPDEITTALSYAPALEVRPFSITRKFSSADLDPIAVGTEVKVATVLTGQFSLEGDDLQVTLEAIDVADSSVLWRDRVAIAETDLIGLRERLSSAVRQNLLPMLDQAVTEGGTSPSHPEAYQKYLQSLAISSDPGANQQALDLLEQAVELDPDYAPAWVQLSWRHALSYSYEGGGRRAQELAIEAAERALELDPDLMTAVRQLVILHAEAARLRDAYDVAQAAVDRRPDSAEAHFALSYVYRYAGLLEESAEECERARAINPTAPHFRSCAVTFRRLGDFARAREFTGLDEGSRHQIVNDGWTALYEGRDEEAERIWQALPEGTITRELIAACGPQGTLEERARVVEYLRPSSAALDPENHYNVARVFALCDAPGLALQFLNLAIEKNYCAVSAFESEAPYASLGDHPDFAAVHLNAIACRERFMEHRRR